MKGRVQRFLDQSNSNHTGTSVSFYNSVNTFEYMYILRNHVSFTFHLPLLIHRAVMPTGTFMQVRKRCSPLFLQGGNCESKAWLASRGQAGNQPHSVLGPFQQQSIHSYTAALLLQYLNISSPRIGLCHKNQTYPNTAFWVMHLTVSGIEDLFLTEEREKTPWEFSCQGGSASPPVILMKCFIQKSWIVAFIPSALGNSCPWAYSSKSFYKLQGKILQIDQIIVLFSFFLF